MPTYKTEGIVLRRIDYREYDRIFTIYTRDFGKVTCTAAGVRKIKSKQAGHLEPFTWSECMFAYGKANINRLATSVTVHPFLSIRKTLWKIACASYCVDVTDRAVAEGEADCNAFDLLTEALLAVDSLDSHASARGIFLVRAYGFKLLSHLGYKPELLACIICEEKIDSGEAYFNALQGGLLHRACMGRETYSLSLPLHAGIITVLKVIVQEEMSTLFSCQFENEAMLHISRIMKSFTDTHLERQVKSDFWLELLGKRETVPLTRR